MKKLIILSSFCILHSSFSQISYINLTSLATNVAASSALITIPGVCSNYTYTVVNSNNIIIGDPIPNSTIIRAERFRAIALKCRIAGDTRGKP